MELRSHTLPSPRTLLLLGGVLAVLTGFYNIGFLALDDYSYEICAMIPGQDPTPLSVWIGGGFRPPLPQLPLSFLGRLLFRLGIEDPAWQLRACLAFLATLNFTVSAWALAQITRSLGESVASWAAGLFGFYFLSSLLFSRPMVESLSIPFVMGSCAFACRYWKEERLRDIQVSLFLLAAGSLVRFQVGSCAMAIFLLPLWKRRYAHVLWLLLGGGVWAFLAGLPDMALGLSYHGALRYYAEYNMHAGEAHGRTPFYTFALLFFALSLPPTFLSRFRGLDARPFAGALLPPLLYFFSFVLAHSLFPHKEERFMIPIIPLFLLLLSPLLAYFYETGKRWRLYYFGAVNGVLLVLVVSQVPQQNIIELVRAIDKSDSIRAVAPFEDSLPMFPSAYGKRTKQVPIHPTTIERIRSHTPWPCDEVLVVRFDKASRLTPEFTGEKFIPVRNFPPGLLERVLVRTNPGRNLRRGQLEAWLPERCTNRL